MCLSDARVSGVAGSAASSSAASWWGRWEVLLDFANGCEWAVESVVEAFRFFVDVDGGVVAEGRAASPMTKQPACGGGVLMTV